MPDVPTEPLRHLPPLAWLQAFEAAARHLSFTAAGEELSVTQSAVSQRIRQLEDRLGQPLFNRHARGLSLTPTGQAWLPSLQQSFERLREGTLEVFGPSRSAPVSVRATPMSQHVWLLPRLAIFHRHEPDIALRLVSAYWQNDFEGDDVDIEIRYGHGDWHDVEAVRVGTDEERMVAVAAPALASALVEPSDLAGCTLLHAAGFAVGWRRWLMQAGELALERETRTITCDTQMIALEMARLGMGVALVHGELFARWSVSDDRGLVRAFELAVPTEERFWLACSRGRALRPTARRLWDFLQERAAGEFGKNRCAAALRSDRQEPAVKYEKLWT